MIYLFIANEADLQEYKRDIANTAQPSILWIVRNQTHGNSA